MISCSKWLSLVYFFLFLFFRINTIWICPSYLIGFIVVLVMYCSFLVRPTFLMWIKHYFRCLEEFFLTFNYLIHFDVLYVEVEIAKGSLYSIYLHFMVLLQEHLKQTNKKTPCNVSYPWRVIILGWNGCISVPNLTANIFQYLIEK